MANSFVKISGMIAEPIYPRRKNKPSPNVLKNTKIFDLSLRFMTKEVKGAYDDEARTKNSKITEIPSSAKSTANQGRLVQIHHMQSMSVYQCADN